MRIIIRQRRRVEGYREVSYYAIIRDNGEGITSRLNPRMQLLSEARTLDAAVRVAKEKSQSYQIPYMVNGRLYQPVTR